MQAGLSATALSDRNPIPVRGQIDFLALVSRAVADDWIGLTLAADFDLREMGMLYYVAASSGRLGDALQRLERYARLGNEALVVRIKEGPVCCGLSERTFSRRLKAEGLTFAEILDDLRRDLAVRYLEERSLPVLQISWLARVLSPMPAAARPARTPKNTGGIFRLAPRCQPELASVPQHRNGPTKASRSQNKAGTLR